MDALTPVRARAMLNQIKEHLATAIGLIYEFRTSSAYKALGYATWNECVRAEFAYAESHLYRLAWAGEANVLLAGTAEAGIPERQVRPLEPLSGDPDLMLAAWQAAEQTALKLEKRLTSTIVQAAATVARELFQAGTVSDGEGSQIKVLSAAIAEEAEERLKRHRQYIMDAVTRKFGEVVLPFTQGGIMKTEDGLFVQFHDDALLNALSDGWYYIAIRKKE